MARQPTKRLSIPRARPSKVKPKTGKTTKGTGLTIRQVLQAEHPTVKRTKKMVRMRKLLRNKKLNRVRIVTETRDKVNGRSVLRKHTTIVWPKDPEYSGKLSDKNVKLMFQCDCAFFVYHLEVAYHRKGAANIVGSNGESPIMTNPRLLTSYTCKHLAIALPIIIKKKL